MRMMSMMAFLILFFAGGSLLLMPSSCLGSNLNQYIQPEQQLDLPDRQRAVVNRFLLTQTNSGGLLTEPKDEADMRALLAFKQRIAVDPSHLLSTWNSSDALPCNWTGVTCNGDFRVVGLDLKLSNLSGTIAPELGNLQHLTHLNLSVNNLVGEIPSELGQLKSLSHLDFKWNQLQGSIPTELGQCRALVWLDLSHNQLNGSIPSSLGSLTNLYMLQLHDISNLTGTIPPQLGLLKNLTYLYLGSNSLEGSIPPAIGQLGNLLELTLFLNKLTGSIPPELGQLRNLESLALFQNNFEGSIPPELGQLINLRQLYLFSCNLSGVIPPELGNLSNLQYLDLYTNQLSGPIPPELGQLEKLVEIKLFSNKLNGSIPPQLGRLKNLQQLFLYSNSLSGPIPSQLGQLINLQNLYLYSNNLTGPLPAELGRLQNLQNLIIFSNNIHGHIPPEFGGLKSLVSIYLGNNSFSGTIPSELGMLENLQYLEMNINGISGDIPPALANLSNLIYIHASNNRLSGRLPPFLANCTKLQWIKLGNNSLYGQIPPEFSSLSRLHTLSLSSNSLTGTVPAFFANHSSVVVLDLRDNNLRGSLPDSWGQSENLRVLSLGYNRFDGALPFWIWNLNQLQLLDMSHNFFSGSIPHSLGQLKGLQRSDGGKATKEDLWYDGIQIYAKGIEAVYWYVLAITASLDLSGNELSGEIPEEIGLLNGLFNLNLSSNKLTGTIPSSLRHVSTLESLDLSNNQLEGQIPHELVELTYLAVLDVSNNHLSGEIPKGGQFNSFSNQSYVGNPKLCGFPLSLSCSNLDLQPALAPSGGSHQILSRNAKVAIAAGIVAGLICMGILGTIVFRYYFYSVSEENSCSETEETALKLFGQHLEISTEELFRGTNGFDDKNVIGEGGLSMVYKGVLRDQKVVAVKRLKMFNSSEAQRSFSAECKILGQIRHRNLVRILGACSTREMKALILDYMPNGSLDMHLHNGEACKLRWEERLRVANGVAEGLAYLHSDTGYGQILHCDLKPSNILLDEDFEPRINDFGIARLIEPTKDGATLASTFGGSIGYIAPEYAYAQIITDKTDVYSYGVVLLEMLTGRRPTDGLFAAEGTSLRAWVLSAYPDKLKRELIIDPALLKNATPETRDDMCYVLKIGLLCTQELPRERPTIREVLELLRRMKTTAGSRTHDIMNVWAMEGAFST